jgi:hypothetical protein
MIRRRVRNEELGTSDEFDAIVIAGETLFLNETKSKPSVEYVNDFLDKTEEIPTYFPEYANKKIVPLFSSLFIPEDVLTYLTKQKNLCSRHGWGCHGGAQST